MLTLSFGQCRILLNLLEERTAELPRSWPLQSARKPSLTAPQTAARYVQGGSVSLPLSFDSGIMRGRFNPHDGQLYVTGLRGWVSAAVKDGCFQRVRFTGQTPHLPRQIRTLENGLALSFCVPLNRESAEDPDSYSI